MFTYLMKLNTVAHVALRNGIIFTKFKLGPTHPLLTYDGFTVDTLRHAVTLTFDPLTWKSAVYRLSHGQTLYQN